MAKSKISGLPQPRAAKSRTVRKVVRLEPAEHRAQVAAAKQSGRTWSDWIRWLAAREMVNHQPAGEDLRLTHRAMLAILASQQCRRGEYTGTEWNDVEIDVMHHAVNCERRKHGLPDIERGVVVRMELKAAGHSDYSSKFALYCAGLALPEAAS